MVKELIALVFCAAPAVPAVHAETFVLRADQPDHEATVKIPVSAVTQLSADFAESLVGVANPQFEAMRLRGDVSISITGSTQPIQIKADNLLLELTPDSTQRQPKSGRSDAAANKLLRSTITLPGDDNSEIFVGHVMFDVQTTSGPMEIKADRVEHQLKPDDSTPQAGT